MKIALASDMGPVKVSAFPVGKWLAVHRAIRGEGWRVTHVASGRCLPHLFPSRRIAEKAAVRSQRLIAWSRVPDVSHLDYDEANRRLRRFMLRQPRIKSLDKACRAMVAE